MSDARLLSLLLPGKSDAVATVTALLGAAASFHERNASVLSLFFFAKTFKVRE